MIYYAGIGARDTPSSILEAMGRAATSMAKAGLTLRSGGAEGADESFEHGCDLGGGNKEIFLPWQGFRKNSSPLFGTTREARLLAKEFHPNWANVSCSGRDFHGRNVYQILGQDLNTPSAFVICWTADGKVKGGTGQALRMAEHFKIPIFNLGKPEATLTSIGEEIMEVIENAQKTDIPF